MITKQNIYNYMKYLGFYSRYDNFRIIDFYNEHFFNGKYSIISVNFEYSIDNNIVNDNYNIHRFLFNQWIISNRKEKLKLIEGL